MRRKHSARVVLITIYTAALGALFALAPFAPARAVDGVLIEKRESLYNTIFVYERDGLILMSFGHNNRYWRESSYDPSDERILPSRYTRVMTVALAYAAKVDKILEIGFGGGRTAWYLHRALPDSQVRSVELDPDVVMLAKKYFGIRAEPNFQVTAKDGRLFLAHDADDYDVILLDAYRGPFVPFHLLTKEFYTLVAAHLVPGGAVAQNIEPTTMLFDSALATLESVFSHVDLYDAGGNVVAVAYNGPAPSQEKLRNVAKTRQKEWEFYYPLPGLVAGRRLLKHAPPAKLLTDDFAPVETLKAIERHNRKLDDLTEAPE
jgi:spermidine synthase